jgi:putative protease
MATIAIYSLKGGVGKTTLAVNLAWTAAVQSSRRTLLWDLDPQAASTFLLTQKKPKGDALSIFSKDVAPDKLIRRSGTPQLDLIPADASLREHLARFGATIFAVNDVGLQLSQPWFIPASAVNALRRDALADLEANRAKGFMRLQRATPVEPPAQYPEDTLSFLGNVFNQKAHDFYVRHGVKVIDAAYEAHEEEGEVSLMITKHCVRFSMSLCPKQAKGVTGVQGTIKAEPLMLVNGKEKLTLRFDCKPCEMHVVGKMKGHILDLPLPGSAAAKAVVGHITPEDLMKTARQRAPR